MLRAGRMWPTRIQLVDTWGAVRPAMASADARPAGRYGRAALEKPGFTVPAKPVSDP